MGAAAPRHPPTRPTRPVSSNEQTSVLFFGVVHNDRYKAKKTNPKTSQERDRGSCSCLLLPRQRRTNNMPTTTCRLLINSHQTTTFALLQLHSRITSPATTAAITLLFLPVEYT